MDEKELYLLSVEKNGIAQEQYSQLSAGEKAMLEKSGERYWLSPQCRSKFRVALTGGVFDVLHIGHMLTLQKAREQADLLIAVVTANDRVEKVKGRKPIHDAEYRRAMVSAIRYVDLAISGSSGSVMETFERVKIGRASCRERV